jgi:long-chain acyl-CoA synthetase
MDDDGYVYIVDRKKDRIVSGDENVCSIEVENAISGHPSVLVTAVIGVPDDHWREAVTAVVVPRPGHELTEQGLIEHCQKRIARYKVPKKIVFASELPKSGAGKILKREIRQKFWKGQQRLVH